MAERMHEWRQRRLAPQGVPRFRTRGLTTLSLLVLLLLLGYMFLKGKVIRVVDGDTVQVLARAGRLETLRLYGIDAPAGSRRREAVAFIEDAALLREVEVLSPAQDQRDHGTALILLPDGLMLNEELVRRGLARVSLHSCTQAFCASWLLMEQEARAARRGLWADDLPAPSGEGEPVPASSAF